MIRSTLALAAAAAAFASPALADPVPLVGSLTANWYTVTPGSLPGRDFQSYCCSDLRSDMVRANLGANGLPVLNPSTTGPQTFNGVDPVTGELQWWTPGTTAAGDIVTFTSSTTVSIPFADSSMFPPDGKGSGNGGANGFQTTHFFGTFSFAHPTILTWTMSADDDAFFFVNGEYVTGLGGVHPLAASPVVSKLLAAGTHRFDLFYADRHTTQAQLFFSATVEAQPIPEPATWAMLIAGFGLIGLGMRRRRTTAVAVAA
jgi:fibro-slime domain-containing protein